MVWQDIIIALANVLFGYSLVWQVLYGFKKKKKLLSVQSTLLTALGLYALTITYLSLNLYMSTCISFLNGSLLLLLFVQSIIYRKN